MLVRAVPVLLVFLSLLSSVSANATSCPGLAQLVHRDVSQVSSLHASLAVFEYGNSATAYFIGGEPGYLITASHAIENSSQHEVCSRFTRPYDFERECYTVSRNVAELRKYDLALLRLDDELPDSVRPLDLSFERIPPGVSERYRILGYSKPREATERTYSEADGTIRQIGRVSALNGDSPLRNVAVYHVDASQYEGASGGPLVGPRGLVWATIPRGADLSQQGYGIPHWNNEVISWLVSNTEPSIKASALQASLLDASSGEEVKEILSAALDIRKRAITNLDLWHVLSGLVEAGKFAFLREALDCPLNYALSQGFNLDVFNRLEGLSSPSSDIAATYESLKEIYAGYATSPESGVVSSYWRVRSAAFALRANQVLASEDLTRVVASEAQTYDEIETLQQFVGSNIQRESDIGARIGQNYSDAAYLLSEPSAINSGLQFSSLITAVSGATLYAPEQGDYEVAKVISNINIPRALQSEFVAYYRQIAPRSGRMLDFSEVIKASRNLMDSQNEALDKALMVRLQGEEVPNNL